MAKYMAIYSWNGTTMAHFEEHYSVLSNLIDDAFKDGISTVQVYTLNRYNEYEILLTIHEHR